MLICEYCDSTLENGTTTCPHCGGTVKAPSAQEPVYPEAAPQAQEIPSEESEQTLDASKILKTAAAAVGVVAGVSMLGGLLKPKTGHTPVVPHIGSRARARRSGMGGPGGPGGHGGFGGGRGGHRGGTGGRR